jgi:hypothetical protein
MPTKYRQRQSLHCAADTSAHAGGIDGRAEGVPRRYSGTRVTCVYVSRQRPSRLAQT